MNAYLAFLFDFAAPKEAQFLALPILSSSEELARHEIAAIYPSLMPVLVISKEEFEDQARIMNEMLDESLAEGSLKEAFILMMCAKTETVLIPVTALSEKRAPDEVLDVYPDFYPMLVMDQAQVEGHLDALADLATLHV